MTDTDSEDYKFHPRAF